jgi:hypothetical protein
MLQASDRSQAAYEIAADRLNKYLEKTRGGGEPAVPPLADETRKLLVSALEPRRFQPIEIDRFLLSDSLHLENCFLYRDIAQHVTRDARDDLTKAEALFDWVVRNVQLIPADQVQRLPASPRVILVVGRGSELERAWTFMELVRQVGLDSVMLGYEASDPEDSAKKRIVAWIPAVLLEDSLYLFDTALGLPVPGPGGKGTATLQQVMDDPTLLAGLDLDPERLYPVGAEQLKELVLLLESSLSYWAPRMRFLQERLAGKNRAVLWSDLARLYNRSKHTAGVSMDVALWVLPLIVDEHSHGDKAYGNQIMQLLTPYLPYLDARLGHLRGKFGDAIRAYLSNRAALPPQIETIPNAKARYERAREDSTYFLGLVKFEEREYGPAGEWGKRYLQRYPSGVWVAGVNYYLGRCAEAQQDSAKAIEYFTAPDPSRQGIGNLVRARRLGWTPPPNTSTSKDAPLSATRADPGSR